MDLESIWRFLTDAGNPWVIVGYLGQFLFSMRFIVQWITSERPSFTCGACRWWG